MILVTVKNSKTGSQYICKSASKTVKYISYKHISYYFICRYRNHPFFKQLYHGPNGIQIGSERYKEIEALKKSIWNTPIHELLDITIEETNLDGSPTYSRSIKRKATKYNYDYRIWHD